MWKPLPAYTKFSRIFALYKVWLLVVLLSHTTLYSEGNHRRIGLVWHLWWFYGMSERVYGSVMFFFPHLCFPLLVYL